jgi:hypothetical protein
MDDEDRKWAVFLAGWLARFGTEPVRPSTVVASAAITRDPFAGTEVDPWDGDFITDKEGRRVRTAQKLGAVLTSHVDRPHGDPTLWLRAVADGHNHSTLYWVQEDQP